MNENEFPIEADYTHWAKKTLSTEFNDIVSRVYDANLTNALNLLQEHEFFTGIESFLLLCAEEYKNQHSADLLMSKPSIDLLKKSYDSAVNKSYRHNIIWNQNYPKEPKDCWMTPENWFEKINDLIRSTIVCKYIDGPAFLANKLKSRAEELKLKNNYSSQQKDDGYYAYHFYVYIPVTFVDKTWNEFQVELSIEIQLTTQLQEVLYNITHEFYNQLRIQAARDRSEWKWQFKSNRFRAGYLCHTLHLLEAIILDLRDGNKSLHDLNKEQDIEQHDE